MYLRDDGRRFRGQLLGGEHASASVHIYITSRALTRDPRSRRFLARQKYGQVAFDTNQKAVLTSCVLRYKPLLPSSGATTPANLRGKPVSVSTSEPQDQPSEQGMISCCFSFTIRRDPYGIPTLIVGNFIKC